MKKEELVFVPLGGTGEIGMNLSLYGYGTPTHRQWLIVDCGVAFAGPELPGIDLIMPDIRFLEGERKNIAGMVITHGHEDHIGALLDLWPKLKCPIYATPFTASLIEVKRFSERGAPKININTVKTNSIIDIGVFNVEFINVAHSIPESQALAIRTPAGLVVHSGDWKIDKTPILGTGTDEKRLRELGDEGVLALISDSTNAVREGRSPSEQEVTANLTTLIKEAKGRVCVTTFASNVARIRAVAEAAMACDRQVVVVGRAMDRVLSVAREQGMLDGLPPFAPVEAYGYLPKDKVVAVLTGSQGEPRAALARISENRHPDVTLNKGDLVIFSSRAIPGNEKGINSIINGLIRQDVEVITDRTHMIHVSGHPRKEEMEDLYSWLRPTIAVPVHGEALHMKEHAKLALKMGAKHVKLLDDGDMLLLDAEKPMIIDKVPAGKLYKDGNLLIEAAQRTMPERRKLAECGVISCGIAVDEKGEILTDPEIELCGFPEIQVNGETFQTHLENALDDMLDNLPKSRLRDPEALKESAFKTLRSKANSLWGKKPVVMVQVLVV